LSLSAAATVLSILAICRCNFVDIDKVDGVSGVFAWILDLVVPQSFGLWCYEDSSGASFDASDLEFDENYQAARILGTVVLCIGLVILLLNVMAVCNCLKGMAHLLVGILCALNSVMQGLVFVVLQSDVCALGCSLGTGGKCGVAATIVWFLAGTTSCASWKQKS
jgi:hypothetical protein